MSTIGIIAAGIISVSVGAWVYAKCTYAERKAGRDALAAQHREQKRIEDEGRRRNEEAVKRKELIELLDWILRDPEVLRDRQYPSHQHSVNAPSLYEFAKNVRHFENLSHRIAHTAEGQQATAKALREVREVQKEIQKALQMGHPVE